MLPDDLIADLIGATPGGLRTGDGGYLAALLNGAPATSLGEATGHLTAKWKPNWSDHARRNFDTDDLSRYPIVVLPSPAFAAESILVDGAPCVLVHHGLMELIGFAVECDLLGAQAARSLRTSRSGARTLERIEALTRFIFRSHIKNPARLPKLSQWLSDKSRQGWALYVLSAEVFALLHEIAHIRLGHLESFPGPFDDASTYWQQRELDADALAMEMAGRGREILLLGAWSFLWWFSYYQAAEKHYSNYYPTAIARFESLIDRHADRYTRDLGEELRGMRAIAEFLHGGGHLEDIDQFNRGQLGTPLEAQQELQGVFHMLLA